MDELIAAKRRSLDYLRAHKPLPLIKILAQEKDAPRHFLDHISKPRPPEVLHIVSEIASPTHVPMIPKSLSLISMIEELDVTAISIKTWDKPGFCSEECLEKFFSSLIKETSKPILLNDLIIDEYQVYLARALGADSYTLYPGIIDTAELQYFIEIGRDLNMEAWVSVRDETVLPLALKTDAKILALQQDILTQYVSKQDFPNIIDNIRTSNAYLEAPRIIAVEESSCGTIKTEELKLFASTGIEVLLTSLRCTPTESITHNRS